MARWTSSAITKRIAVLVAVLVVGTATLWLWFDREPRWHGRTLSSWLKEEMANRNTNAEHAILQIGTNGIPTMLKMFKASDGPWKTKLAGKLEALFGKKLFTSATDYHWMAERGLELLWPESESATGALVEIWQKGDGDGDAADAAKWMLQLVYYQDYIAGQKPNNPANWQAYQQMTNAFNPSNFKRPH